MSGICDYNCDCCKLNKKCDMAFCNKIYDSTISLPENYEELFEIGYTSDFITHELKFNHIALVPRIKYPLK